MKLEEAAKSGKTKIIIHNRAGLERKQTKNQSQNGKFFFFWKAFSERPMSDWLGCKKIGYSISNLLIKLVFQIDNF